MDKRFIIMFNEFLQSDYEANILTSSIIYTTSEECIVQKK